MSKPVNNLLSLIAKGIAVLLVLVAVAGLAIWHGGWGGSEARHPSLASAELPPLIPIRDFFANTGSEWGYRISPDGKWMVWEAVEGTQTVIRVAPVDDLSNPRTMQLPRGTRFVWHPDSIGLIMTHGNYYTRMRTFVADIRPDSFEAEPSKWKEITPRGLERYTLLPKSGNTPWLLLTDRRYAGRSDVYEVTSDGIGKAEIRRNESDAVSRWLIDTRNRIVGRFMKLDDVTYAIETDPDADNRDWKRLGTFTVFDHFNPFIFNADHWYVMSGRGRDHLALVKLDLESGKETVVHAERDRSVIHAMGLGHDVTEPDFLRIGSGEPDYVALSERGKKLLAALSDVEKPFEFNILETTKNVEKVTVAISEREDSWFYRLIDLENGTQRDLGEYDMRRHKQALAETQFMKITARDGLEIPVLLTLPKGVEAKDLPMVVLAHGGPARHVDWGYDHETQFLANRGYAVLNVNYRGSTGFGRAFQEAGYHEFGRKMQGDFIDAAQAMIDRGIADPDAIAIYGASMGGYSAMMGVARDPGFFAAGISVVGVSDWVRDAEEIPQHWFADFAYVTRYFGDAKNPDDLAAMRANSPINLADRVKAPMLIAHGVKDPIVHVDQSRNFEAALRENGVPVEAVYYENEGHGWARWQTKIDWHRRLEDFLAEHLGGRSGGFDYTEIGAKLF